MAKSIIQTSDGGYITAGYSGSRNGDISDPRWGEDYWIVKLDNTGNTEWQKSLGGTNSETARSILQTSDGGYIVAGHSTSIDGDVSGKHRQVYPDYWIVKLDETGNIEWQKSLGGTGSDAANSILQTLDGGYMVAGSSQSNDGDVSGSHGDSDYWIVKLDETGNIEWQKSLGGKDLDNAQSIIQTSDGGYMAAGWSTSNDGDVSSNYGRFDFWIVKLY